jgi:hypothetical protein
MALDDIRYRLDDWIDANAYAVDATVLTDCAAAPLVVEILNRAADLAGSVFIDDDMSLILSLGFDRLEFGNLDELTATDEVLSFLEAIREPRSVYGRHGRWLVWDAPAGRRRVRLRSRN